MQTDLPMSRNEFIRRFVDRLVSAVGEEIAPTYYDDPEFGPDADPEECADADMSYWEG